MLPGPILTVLTRVSSYQAQSKTSFHLTSRLTCPLALSSRAWHLPFRPETECAVFRVVGRKNHFEHWRQPFRNQVILDAEGVLDPLAHWTPATWWSGASGRIYGHASRSRTAGPARRVRRPTAAPATSHARMDPIAPSSPMNSSDCSHTRSRRRGGRRDSGPSPS